MSASFVGARPSDAKHSLLEKLPAFKEKLNPADFSNIIGFYSQNKTNGFMSNFYKSFFKINVKQFAVPGLEKVSDSNGNLCFTNSEQAFMLFKGITFYHRNPVKNLDVMCRLMKSTDPVSIKKLGRMLDCSSVSGAKFDEETWNKERCACMYDALWYKFNQNVNLLNSLIDTGECYLVEATQNDKNWGNGRNISDGFNDPSVWAGTNLLGETLMVLRDVLFKNQVKSNKSKMTVIEVDDVLDQASNYCG